MSCAPTEPVEKHDDISVLQDFINLIGIESPGLTCSLAIGEYVQSIIN